MKNSTHILILFAIIGLIAINTRVLTSEVDSINLENLDKDLRRKIFLEELNDYDRKLDKKLLELTSKKRINKRSDIDARLLELQAKILLTKIYAGMPVGHGRFDFEEIGKRSIDSQEFYQQKLSEPKVYGVFSQEEQK